MHGSGRFYAWTQLRSSWRRRLALVAALGVVGAVAIGSAAGAVRTGSAVDRFLTDQRAFDVLVFCGPAERDGDGYACETKVRDLEEIADTAAIVALPGVLSVAGQGIELTDDTCYSGSGDVQLVVAPDSRFGTAINSHRFVEGRPADPSQPDEIVITRELAQRTEVGVGDTIDVQLFAGADCLDAPQSWQSARTLTVVGIEVSPFEVRPESGDYFAWVHGTPALLAEVGDLPDAELVVAGRLRPGQTFEEMRSSLEDLGVAREAVVPGSINADNLERSTRPYVAAQWMVSALAALAGLILLGQVLNRQVRADTTEFRGLGQLGMTRRNLAAIGMTQVLSIVLPAALLASLGGYLASAFTPLGVARILEANAGLRVDASMLALGASVMVIGLVALTIPSVLVAARHQVQPARSVSGRGGSLARRMGGGPVSTTGLRMAFEPIQGPSAPALRTGFGVVVTAVILLVGASVFAGSLTHLLGSKHLIGWNWDVIMFVEGNPEGAERITADRLQDVVADTPGVVAANPASIFGPMQVFLGPERVALQMFAFVGGPIGPTLISGREPSGSDEIVLGRETMARLGYHQGDQVPFVALVGDWEELQAGGGTEVPGTVTIVGTAVIPGSGGDSRLGTGGAVDFDFYRAILPEVEPDGVFVRLEPGARLDEVQRAVADQLGAPEVAVITEEILGEEFLDVARVRNLPIALAALLGLLAVGVIAQVIVGSTHSRRGELGVLRALGFRPRQIRMAIVVQALAITVVALIVGIPLGLALGRSVWTAFALSLGTKPEVIVATASLVGLVVGLLVLASLLGVIGSARTRRHLASALRRE